ncbi:MAG: hypothetical protein L3J59_12625 [Methylococcaceae bacterium]|nr:hypothetical protein [Methylococcaceae bacterium]
MKIINKRQKWIRPILVFGLIISSLFVQALSSPDNTLQWNKDKYRGLYFLEKETGFLNKTTRDCPEYRYAVVFLHGTQNTLTNSPTQAIDGLVDHSKNGGVLQPIMENFSHNCALVVLPEAKISPDKTFKQWDWELNSADSRRIIRIIKFIQAKLDIDVILMGGSGGAVMAHHIAKESIKDSNKVDLTAVIIVDGVSSELACQKPCISPKGHQPIHSSKHSDLYNADINERRVNNWDSTFDTIRVGVNNWNLPTLVISSFENLNGKIPSLFKDRFGFALERKGARQVIFKRNIGKDHAPWKPGYIYIKDFLVNTLKVDNRW